MNALSIKGFAIGLVIGLIAGLVAGYISITVLTLQVVQLQAEIEEKDAKISDLSTQLGDKSGEVADLQKRIEELEAKIGESERPEDVITHPSPLISSKYPAKTVTWADGTSETIQVDDKGRIYLNGEEVIAFGYNICVVKGFRETYGNLTDELAEKMLSWLEDKGVRFMTLCYDRVAAKWAEYIEFWMRHLYAHKMFVHFTLRNRNGKNIDVTNQYNHFKQGIDKINELPQAWMDGIYAVMMPCWELDMFYDYDTLDDYLSRIKPLCRDYLRASKIGDVPLTGKTSHAMWNDGGIAIVKHSDIPCWDCYPYGTNIDYGLSRIREEVLPKGGKTGYQIWLSEHGYATERDGRHCSGNVDPGYPPELLDRLLDKTYFLECSAIFIWALQYYDGDRYQDAGAFFQNTGEPKQWTINLAPHFPKCETLPVVDAGPDRTVAEDTLVTFDGSGSSDNIGITSYTWTFMDVTRQTLTGINPTYTFSTPGCYTVTLKATDATGNHATDTVTITVLDVTKPVADVGDTVAIGTTVAFNAGDSSDNVAIVSYEWDFGDGTTGTGVTTTHTYTEPGNYTATLTVRDAAGNSDTDTIVVTVFPAPIPWWIVGVMVATVIAFVVLVLWGRKRGKD